MKLENSNFVKLYTELAHAMLEESFYGEINSLYETDENGDDKTDESGDERYTEEAQELFDDYRSRVLKVLERNGVKQKENKV
tara:strand:- start:1503 stop:1748 length:246 start_codon:yes stop_codon:yes gene_type:complete